MNDITIYTLKFLHKIYSKAFGKRTSPKPQADGSPDSVADIIYKALTDAKPAMIARIGATEMSCLVNYLSVNHKQRSVLTYVKGKTPPWWWETSVINQMKEWSGFFPANEVKLEEFCKLMLEDIALVDVLGSWLAGERYFDEQLKNSKKVHFELLNPYFSSIPWTKALAGKKVLVVHPFTQTIEEQYEKRELLFENNLLPEFELKTIKAVQSIAGTKTEFADWFEALNYMKAKIEEVDFDICLIGCGAYGLPLAAHVKRMGKKGFHLGGSLQLLFGIKGKRWENENYNKQYNFANLMNEYWIKPSEDERPQDAMKVEGACYW